ncbi:MAG: serine hydrolase, partial [Bradyrhizobium sp.]|nr:serine hydrolase [Bradyrhizobium sp.]
MTRRRLLFVVLATTALTALAVAAARARDVPQVATGFIASVVCSETFVSGVDPDRILSETQAAMPG